MSTIAEYLESLRGKSVAVIGMGVSNTPLIRMMLRAGLKVTVCDKSPREGVEALSALKRLTTQVGFDLHVFRRSPA